jgi:2-polyprenyl-6-methoxyphenol hydroxylase-like FAD-dependent oxidoreductase
MSGKLKILIVGGGIGGMAAAIRFAELGNQVDLIDIDPDWRVYGAGITITGPTLRAYSRLGLLDKLKAQGAITTKTRLFRFDGHHILDLDEPVIEDGLPDTPPHHARPGARTGYQCSPGHQR